MSRLKYHMLFAHTYLTEMFTVVLFASLLNILNTEHNTPLLSSLIIIIFIQMILSHIIVSKFNLSYVYILVPAVLILMILLGHFWVTSLIVSAVGAYRLEQLHDSVDHGLEHVALVVSFVLLILINVFSVELTTIYTALFHQIFIAMTLFYFLGKIAVHLMENRYNNTLSTMLFISVSLILLTLSMLIIFIYQPIISTLQNIITGLLYLFSLAISPLFTFLENMELTPPEEVESLLENDMGSETEQNEFEQSQSVTGLPFEAVFGTLIVVFVVSAIIIYFIRRGRLSKNTKAKQRHNKHTESIRFDNRRPGKTTAPDHRGRKEYFEFERWLAKNDYGRYKDETISEWIGRLKLDEYVFGEDLEKYRRLRYKDIELTDEEFQEFKDSVSRMKKNIQKRR